jgi:hypothetical protein
MLVVEIESLLAGRRAAWAGQPALFTQRLMAADSLALYRACIKTLHEELERDPLREKTGPLHRLGQLVQMEMCRLEEKDSLWQPTPLMEELV